MGEVWKRSGGGFEEIESFLIKKQSRVVSRRLFLFCWTGGLGQHVWEAIQKMLHFALNPFAISHVARNASFKMIGA